MFYILTPVAPAQIIRCATATSFSQKVWTMSDFVAYIDLVMPLKERNEKGKEGPQNVITGTTPGKIWKV
ncbi:hypothetical protein EEK90_05005 [Muribaculaceae bacterium Isolate-036 (Harlan)]|nr:hypothetical protein EEK90_05005 [Muribaculaceae bacterium Isolate-036 (Harlan)]